MPTLFLRPILSLIVLGLIPGAAQADIPLLSSSDSEERCAGYTETVILQTPPGDWEMVVNKVHHGFATGPCAQSGERILNRFDHDLSRVLAFQRMGLFIAEVHSLNFHFGAYLSVENREGDTLHCELRSWDYHVGPFHRVIYGVCQEGLSPQHWRYPVQDTTYQTGISAL